MNRESSFEQDCTNTIDIKINGIACAQIIKDGDINEEDLALAEFIVNACNEKENGK